VKGVTECQKCNPGQFADGTATIECKQCDAGSLLCHFYVSCNVFGTASHVRVHCCGVLQSSSVLTVFRLRCCVTSAFCVKPCCACARFIVVIVFFDCNILR
jgi:hypothetical protein